jgi:hypothetical protein
MIVCQCFVKASLLVRIQGVTWTAESQIVFGMVQHP